VDEWIDRLEALTLTAYSEREVADEEYWERFVDARDQVVNQILKFSRDEITDLQRDRIRHLLTYDQEILGRMNWLKQDARERFGKIHEGRVQRDAYDTYYEPESVFFDKRK